MRHHNSQAEAKLIQRVDAAPNGKQLHRWTLRDDNRQHYHGRVPTLENPMYLALSWKANANSKAQLLGIFQLDLCGLLSAGYIRLEKPDREDEVRVRFYRANNKMIYLQTKNGAPALAVVPAAV